MVTLFGKLEELFSYDPSSVSPEIRSQMVGILKARTELQSYAAQVTSLRARIWAGEEGLVGITELKTADLTALQQDYLKKLLPFLKSSVNLDKLEDLIPVIVLAVLQTLNVPLPVLAEALGLDLGKFKALTEDLKDFLS